jgi:hypothetical protein
MRRRALIVVAAAAPLVACGQAEVKVLPTFAAAAAAIEALAAGHKHTGELSHRISSMASSTRRSTRARTSCTWPTTEPKSNRFEKSNAIDRVEHPRCAHCGAVWTRMTHLFNRFGQGAFA